MKRHSHLNINKNKRRSDFARKPIECPGGASRIDKNLGEMDFSDCVPKKMDDCTQRFKCENARSKRRKTVVYIQN